MSAVKCNFCGKELVSVNARKRHNRKCEANTRRQPPKEEHDGKLDAETFSEVFDDLPDGAFFAMAEEHGLYAEDFI